MTANNGVVNIAVNGPDHSLMFYSAANGTSDWHAETVLPAVTTFSAPSIVVAGNEVYIAFEALLNELAVAWAVNGSPTWTIQPLPAPVLQVDRFPPGVAANGNAVDVTYCDTKGQLKFLWSMFYWAAIGTGTWHAETVAGANSTLSSPSITANGNAANISAIGPGSELGFYWALDGTSDWHGEAISGGVGLPLP
jgi:hypothetical protein